MQFPQQQQQLRPASSPTPTTDPTSVVVQTSPGPRPQPGPGRLEPTRSPIEVRKVKNEALVLYHKKRTKYYVIRECSRCGRSWNSSHSWRTIVGHLRGANCGGKEICPDQVIELLGIEVLGADEFWFRAREKAARSFKCLHSDCKSHHRTRRGPCGEFC